MNSRKAEITPSDIRELPTKVAQAVDPSRWIDRRWIHELVDDASKVVAHEVASLADLEKVRRIIASQRKVVAIGGDGCFIVSTCGNFKLRWRLLEKKQQDVPALANVATPARESPRSAREAVMVAEWLVSFSQMQCNLLLLILLCCRT